MARKLEKVWLDREERLYPELFGRESEGVFTIDRPTFKNVFGVKKVDPRWLHMGVLVFAPTLARESWLYITSGGSNPWEEDAVPEEIDERISGIGVEFVMETPRREDWPILALQRVLAYQVLCSCGYYGENPGLGIGHRMPAGGSMDGKNSQLKVFVFADPKHYSSPVTLDSGKFHFLHCVGITETERDYAKANGSAKLIEELEETGAFPVTDARRRSLRW